jgi:hypothetical protein
MTPKRHDAVRHQPAMARATGISPLAATALAPAIAIGPGMKSAAGRFSFSHLARARATFEAVAAIAKGKKADLPIAEISSLLSQR